MTEEPSGLIGSAQRALQVLEVVASAGDGIAAKAVARRAGFKLSTTYHLLNTLVHEGYLIRLGHGRGFGLGYKVGGLYQQLCAELDVAPRLQSELAALHRRAGAAAYYTVFRDTEIVVAAVADSPEHPRAEPLNFGFHEAAHATAFGKVMLAALPPRARKDYLVGAGLPRLTGRTTVRAPELDDELEHVTKAGVALEIEEFQRELACVSAPVLDANDEVAGAVAFSVPVQDFASQRWRLEQTARAGAARFSRLLRTPATPGDCV
ncbi:IclR family transcriptional regulator [Tamaricihabitans halophyticus]|uniref:IclR family transcriptional regulator n=1 Tax=Tamaricihabitans halophyticus TaxID=1262583 RepID=A0A4R2RCW8_9PSEU|nr:IclR family transcriptional regulator [Tamaricihabitans halophyticus]TCP57265.1 IclR family transcriptional regulator [Tamaricihabitans halophyticus]